MKTEANFTRHCEDEDCDLGSFDYICPNCESVESDYEIWWDMDAVYESDYEFECGCCAIDLIATFNGSEIEIECG